jgi:hypothetical protein
MLSSSYSILTFSPTLSMSPTTGRFGFTWRERWTWVYHLRVRRGTRTSWRRNQSTSEWHTLFEPLHFWRRHLDGEHVSVVGYDKTFWEVHTGLGQEVQRDLSPVWEVAMVWLEDTSMNSSLLNVLCVVWYIDRTQFDNIGYFTSMYYMFHVEFFQRSIVTNVHGEDTNIFASEYRDKSTRKDHRL